MPLDPPARTPAEASGASALLVNSRGQYLLHLRDANKPIWMPGTWSLPGGGREAGESLDATIARELLEEAGLVIPDLRPFVRVGHAMPSGLIQVYVGSWEGEPCSLDVAEGIMLHWFDAAALPHLTMDPGAAEVVRLHRAKAAPPAHPVVAPKPAHAEATVLDVVGGHLYLEQDDAVLLGLRHPDSAYAPATWHALAGHCEGESVRACVAREAAEDAGLTIDPADLRLVHTVHMVDPGSVQPRIQLFFSPTRWSGRPTVREPGRCIAWRFWPKSALPADLVPYTRAAVEAVAAGAAYTELGWTRPVVDPRAVG